MGFAKDFVWGAATSSYQIEGNAGKPVPCVWDMFCKAPGNIRDGSSGEVACDHVHRYKQDVALMREIGLQAYRFSISWPRVLPQGTGIVHEAGLDFYDALVNELLENGITPYVTLFHWDYPYALYRRGGWLNPDSPDWFAAYTEAVVNRLSDRVTHWITLNEPQCFIDLGHNRGTHAPGLKLPMYDVLLAGHNALLAHGKSVQAIRAASKQPCKIGYAPVGSTYLPATNAPADIAAAKKATFDVSPDGVFNSAWWMDPVYLGKYPAHALKKYEAFMPDIGPEDMKTICQPLDFQAANIYQSPTVARDGEDGYRLVQPRQGEELTALKWSVTPETLYWSAKFFTERYHLPFLITENGLSNPDWVSADGRVHDAQRIAFLSRYIAQFKKAADEGVPLKGYFCWSLMDNFEWAEGYRERFGLIHVDYETQQRTLKDSAYWYRDVIASGGEVMHG